MIFDIILAASLVLLSIYAFVSDIKTERISNKILLVFGGVQVVTVAIKFIFWDRNDILLYFQNLGIFIFIGAIGYITKVWAGGDCKLIALIALAYPTLFYFDYNRIRVTLWLIIVLAFIISFLFLLFDSFFKAIKLKNSFDYKKMVNVFKSYLLLYIRSFLYLTLLNQVYVFFIYPYFRLNAGVYFILSFAVVILVSRIKPLGNIWALITTAAVDLILMIISGNFAVVTYWKTYLLILLFMIFRAFMSLYNYKMINTEDVKKGMVLSKVDTLLMDKSKVKGLPAVSDESLKSRITSDEAESVRRWENSKYGKAQVTIVRKIPFAAFISIGTIFYLAVGVFQFCGLI